MTAVDALVPVLRWADDLLPLSVVSLGLRGSDGGDAAWSVEQHRWEAGVHTVGAADAERIRAALCPTASDPARWPGLAGGCAAAAERLLGTAGEAGDGDPAGALRAWADALAATARCVVGGAVVADAVAAAAVSAVADAGGMAPDEAVAAVDRAAPARSAAVEEVRAAYAVGLLIADDPAAHELVRTTSPAVAASRLAEGHPGIAAAIDGHLDAWAWLAGPGDPCTRRSEVELVERLQAVLLRWRPELLRRAAAADPVPEATDALGFTPSPRLAHLLTVLACLRRDRAFGTVTLRRAGCLAGSLLHRAGEAVGCPPGTLRFATWEEVSAAVSGREPFPADEVVRRREDGFVLERTGHRLTVQTPGPPVPDPVVLTGMTAARGRAAGRVRIVLAAPQVHRLQPGDVLVTGTSTPDALGGESVFPTRAGPPLGIEHAAAIVTDEGGFLSHAAILAREQGIPCVVGTESATERLMEGQAVEIDATRPVGRVIVRDVPPLRRPVPAPGASGGAGPG